MGLTALDKVEASDSESKESTALVNARLKATKARNLRLVTMEEVRAICDAIEAVVPANLWTLATYHELLFLDAVCGTTNLA